MTTSAKAPRKERGGNHSMFQEIVYSIWPPEPLDNPKYREFKAGLPKYMEKDALRIWNEAAKEPKPTVIEGQSSSKTDKRSPALKTNLDSTDSMFDSEDFRRFENFLDPPLKPLAKGWYRQMRSATATQTQVSSEQCRPMESSSGHMETNGILATNRLNRIQPPAATQTPPPVATPNSPT